MAAAAAQHDAHEIGGILGAELLHDARPMHLDGARAEVTGGHGSEIVLLQQRGQRYLVAGTAHPASDGQPRQTVVTCA